MSKCKRHQIGCIIIKDNMILSTGYNGPARGLPHCEECLRDNIKSGHNEEICRAIHAEQNAIINAARTGISILNGICICTHK